MNPYEKLTKRVKVLDNTFSNYEKKEKDSLIGKIAEVRTEYYFDQTIVVYNEGKLDFYIFNTSDVVEVTPVEHNGVPICIGDEVNGDLVYDYHWSDGNWILRIVKNDNWESECYTVWPLDIKFHIPQQPKGKVDLTTEQLIAELNKRGDYKIEKK